MPHYSVNKINDIQPKKFMRLGIVANCELITSCQEFETSQVHDFRPMRYSKFYNTNVTLYQDIHIFSCLADFSKPF